MFVANNYIPVWHFHLSKYPMFTHRKIIRHVAVSNIWLIRPSLSFFFFLLLTLSSREKKKQSVLLSLSLSSFSLALHPKLQHYHYLLPLYKLKKSHGSLG